MKSKATTQIMRWFTPSRALNGLLILVFFVILFNPSAKALVIRGLMKVGLFQPDIASDSKPLPLVEDIHFTGEKGEAVSLSALHGKVVFINFWATWCPPCIAELPSINELYSQYSSNKNIVFLIVDADSDFGKSIPFITKHHYDLPLYQISSRVPAAMFGNTIPTTVVIDKQGKIVYRNEGAADYTNSKFIAWLNNLAAK